MIATLVLVGGMFFAQALPPPVPAPAPPAQVHVTNEVTVQVPPPDPQATAEMAGQSFAGIFVTIIAPTLASWTNSLLDVPDFYRTTPPDLTYDNAAVIEMSNIVRNAALGLIVLALLFWGTAAVLGNYESPARILVGAVFASGNLIWWHFLIDVNNAINSALSAPTLRSVVGPHLSVPSLTSDPVSAFGPAILVVVYAVVCLLLIAALAFRLGLIDILIAVGSLALICKSSAPTDRFFSTYIGMATGTVFSQVLVVVALKLAGTFALLGGGLAGTLLGIIVLLLARRMPSMLASRFAQPSGGGFMRAGALLLRRVVVRA